MTATITEFEQQWRTWRTERDRWARQPLGWLSLTGLHWLGEEAESFDGLPGRWRADAENVYATIDSGSPARNGSAAVESGAGEVVTQEGAALSGAVTLAPVEGAPGLELRVGDRLIEVIRRSGQAALRIHDPAAPTLAAFTEIPAYEPNPAWNVTGVYTPFEVARVVTTGAVVDGLQHHHSAAGTVTFTFDGTEYTLLVFGSHLLGQHVLFTDGTSGDTTYGGARRLDLPRPAADGTVVLDFNRALNLPCAFTDYATCPVAPPENRLPVAVVAGEKDPRKEHSA
ncbi:DUF1684 domain-containing protein [Nocardia sp. 2]|uniref:DUF1684 domain-containing protein n=1 Tax=Nocardia acididurans TaxID=2802282 RepID=A0ABS1M0B0_9NOCA|nr:DUF1684 domain-containing protein [Nocardia acididurans]MBL1073485.1 DUF1684 domain-containing protein [Nocardia acididurans]